jgi:predicted nucleic acid-binding protein
MNVYVDSSVLLRIILGERGAIREWAQIDTAVSSEISRVECLRTLDRARLRLGLDDEDVSRRRSAVLEQLDTLDVVPLQAAVLARAADPFPTSLRSLDAIHLASAELVRGRYADLSFATHDRELATAARSLGFAVLGA